MAFTLSIESQGMTMKEMKIDLLNSESDRVEKVVFYTPKNGKDKCIK